MFCVLLFCPCTLRFTCSRYSITEALDPVHSGEVDWVTAFARKREQEERLGQAKVINVMYTDITNSDYFYGCVLLMAFTLTLSLSVFLSHSVSVFLLPKLSVSFCLSLSVSLFFSLPSLRSLCLSVSVCLTLFLPPPPPPPPTPVGCSLSLCFSLCSPQALFMSLSPPPPPPNPPPPPPSLAVSLMSGYSLGERG